MKKYFLGLSSAYSAKDTLRHTFAFGGEFDLSELRAYLAAHYGATYDHVAVYANGRTALAVALKNTVKRGGKVVVTSLTCYAVVQAVRAAGCVPIFADVDPDKLHFGKKELENLLAKETNVQAVIVQNNLGIPADIEGIMEVANAHKLSVIEDLAHCVGRKYANGREVGTIGRAVVLSFGKGKSVDAVAGGAVVLTDPLDNPVKQPDMKPAFKDRFRVRFYPLFSAIVRGGYRLNNKLGKGLTAFFVKIHAIKKSADGDINQKIRPTYWQAKLALRQLQGISHRNKKPIRDYYLVNNRDNVLASLEKKGYIFHDIWYDTPVAPERYYSKSDFHPELCPIATKLATQIVNVPNWYKKDEIAPALSIIKQDLVDKDAISENELVVIDEEKEKEKAIKAEKKDFKKKMAEKVKEKKAKKQTEKLEKAGKADKVEKLARKLEKVKQKKAEKEAKAKKRVVKEKSRPERKITKAVQERRVEKLVEADIKTAEKMDERELNGEDSNYWWLEEAEHHQEEIKERETSNRPALNRVYAPSRVDTDESFLEETELEEVEEYEPVAGSTQLDRTMGQLGSLGPDKPDYRDDKKVIDRMTGMRVAPQKISEREMLKREIAAGERGEQNVI
ncbi:DegT/DnrJ/EryC1/StrS aminotransferase family protein [Candidatus Saccharibacteria bacterium]|nr:DegT/DnrJ/EryC1/StrS aminotransferase family protein [Candidatus Saccharibacteria bacterium]